MHYGVLNGANKGMDEPILTSNELWSVSVHKRRYEFSSKWVKTVTVGEVTVGEVTGLCGLRYLFRGLMW